MLAVIILGRATVSAPGFAVVSVILVVVGILAVLHPDALLLALIASLPWEGKLDYPSATLTVVALMRILLPLLFLTRALVGQRPLILPRFLAPLGVFLLLVMLSLMVSPDPGEGIVKTVRYVIFATSLFAAIQFLGSRRMMLRAIRVLTISVAAASIYALVGFLSGHLTRAAGPIVDPNSFSFLLVTVIPLAAFLFLEDRKWRSIWGLALAALLGGTLASLSRGALVGLAGLLVWVVLTRRVSAVVLLGVATTIAIGIVVAFTFFGPVLNQRLAGRERVTGSSGAARTAFWGAAVSMVVNRPLVGVGPERYDAEREKYLRHSPIPLEGRQESGQSSTRSPVRSAHNSYLEVAAEDGVPAAFVFCYFLFAIWSSLRDFLVDPDSYIDGQGKRLAMALQGALVAAVLSGFFVSGQLEAPFWVVGVLAGALTAKSLAGGVLDPLGRRPGLEGRQQSLASRLPV